MALTLNVEAGSMLKPSAGRCRRLLHPPCPGISEMGCTQVSRPSTKLQASAGGGVVAGVATVVVVAEVAGGILCTAAAATAMLGATAVSMVVAVTTAFGVTALPRALGLGHCENMLGSKALNLSVSKW